MIERAARPTDGDNNISCSRRRGIKPCGWYDSACIQRIKKRPPFPLPKISQLNGDCNTQFSTLPVYEKYSNFIQFSDFGIAQRLLLLPIVVFVVKIKICWSKKKNLTFQVFSSTRRAIVIRHALLPLSISMRSENL